MLSWSPPPPQLTQFNPICDFLGNNTSACKLKIFKQSWHPGRKLRHRLIENRDNLQIWGHIYARISRQLPYRFRKRWQSWKAGLARETFSLAQLFVAGISSLISKIKCTYDDRSPATLHFVQPPLIDGISCFSFHDKWNNSSTWVTPTSVHLRRKHISEK